MIDEKQQFKLYKDGRFYHQIHKTVPGTLSDNSKIPDLVKKRQRLLQQIDKNKQKQRAALFVSIVAALVAIVLSLIVLLSELLG